MIWTSKPKIRRIKVEESFSVEDIFWKQHRTKCILPRFTKSFFFDFSLTSLKTIFPVLHRKHFNDRRSKDWNKLLRRNFSSKFSPSLLLFRKHSVPYVVSFTTIIISLTAGLTSLPKINRRLMFKPFEKILNSLISKI